LHLVGILFPHINDDPRSKSLQIYTGICSFKVLAPRYAYHGTTLPDDNVSPAPQHTNISFAHCVAHVSM